MKKIISVISLLFLAIAAWGSESFGSSAEIAPTRYRVTAKAVSIRNAPSKKGHREAVAHKDDYIYGKSLEFVEGGGIKWLKFYHPGKGYLYVSSSCLAEETNPLYVPPAPAPIQKKIESFTWLPRAFLILFALITCLGIFFLGRKLYRSEHKLWEPWYNYFFFGQENKNGMRRMWVFNHNAYLSFIGLFVMVVAGFVATSLFILLTATIILCSSYIIGGLLWVLVVGGWIGVVVGVLLLVFGRNEYGFIGLLGIPVIIFQKRLIRAAGFLFAKGVYLFHSLNPWELSVGLVTGYWKKALLIAAGPLVVFLSIALVWLLIAGIVSLCESIVLYRYNVKNKCETCHKSYEPAKYVIGREADGTPRFLPVPLRPGTYGIFHIRAPFSQERLPTLFLLGKDSLERYCPHCNNPITTRVGEEKFVSFVGVAQSGKTSLLYRCIAELERNYISEITGDIGEDHKLIEHFVDRIKNGTEMGEFPPKTSEGRHRSIQMKLSHKGAMIPYKIYLNDLAGEMFTSELNKAEDAPFFRNSDAILFSIDPMTIKTADLELGDVFSLWYKDHVGRTQDSAGKIDVEMALDILQNTIEKYRKKKTEIQKIPLMIVLTKADTGYLSGVDRQDPDDIRRFLEDQMGLGRFVYRAKTFFENVSYYAVSAKSKVDSEGSGVDLLLEALLKNLRIDKGDI